MRQHRGKFGAARLESARTAAAVQNVEVCGPRAHSSHNVALHWRRAPHPPHRLYTRTPFGVMSRWMEGPNESSRDDPSTNPLRFICHARNRATMDRINDIRSAPPYMRKCREHAERPSGIAGQSIPIRSRTWRSVSFASFEHCCVPLARASSTSRGCAFSSLERA